MLASVSFLASAVALACNQTHSSGNSNSSEQGGEGGVDAIGAGGMTHPINTHYNPPYHHIPINPPYPHTLSTPLLTHPPYPYPPLQRSIATPASTGGRSLSPPPPPPLSRHRAASAPPSLPHTPRDPPFDPPPRCTIQRVTALTTISIGKRWILIARVS